MNYVRAFRARLMSDWSCPKLRYCLTSYTYPSELHETDDEQALQVIEGLPTRVDTMYNTRLRDVKEAGTLSDPDDRMSIEVVMERKAVDRLMVSMMDGRPKWKAESSKSRLLSGQNDAVQSSQAKQPARLRVAEPFFGRGLGLS